MPRVAVTSLTRHGTDGEHDVGDLWQRTINAYLEWLAAGGRSPETRRLRRHYLRRLARVHPAGPWSVRASDLVTFVARPGWAPETRKTARGSVRGFYGWALETGLTDADPAGRLPAVRVPLGRPRPAPDQVLTGALLRAGPRERLMILLAALAGLRRGEIATLRVQDIAGHELHVIGKGGRARTIPLHPTLAAELSRATSGRLDGWVFPGRIDGHLSAHHTGKLLSRLLGPGWTAHKLRHRFATRSYAAERDLLAVQQLLGHQKPETTARYVALPDDALRAAVMAAA